LYFEFNLAINKENEKLLPANQNKYNIDSSQRLAKISTCSLNQWAMDFEGNKIRIINSLVKCKEEGSHIRIGPELEIPGYGCEDHFLELDTVNHSWEVLAEIMDYKVNSEEFLIDNIICDFGMPVIHNGVVYNCRVIVYNREILLIRPKIAMADDGNYRENRWFTPWTKGYILEDFILPDVISNNFNQKDSKIGIAMICARDLSYAPEICEELWIPYSPSIDLTMCGCEIIGNSSGSHFEINKQERRYELIQNSSKKNGGVYVYSNLIGCDGGRLYFDGGSFICVNGKILAEAQRFMLEEVEVTSAVVDLNEVNSYRASIKSRCLQSSQNVMHVPIIKIDRHLLMDNHKKIDFKYDPFLKIQPRIYTFEEEMAQAPSCWLWDYLRRSGASGFFLPLSGGADSTCVAIIVSLMTRMVYNNISTLKSKFVLEELRRVVKDKNYIPKSSEEICNLIFVTTYMGTEYSSKETCENAKFLSKELGATHLDVKIDKILQAFQETFTDTLGKELKPKFLSQGGTYEEDIALQNIQARTRMVFGYLLAGLTNWTRKKQGFLLVLASANLDEGITGYMTKYDCSSGDINPIGSISKVRLRKFLEYCHNNPKINIKSLKDVLKLQPSAELRPSEQGKKMQTDEDDLGMTFEELSLMGQLRKDFKCGPFSMFDKLRSLWKNLPEKTIQEKVERFFKRYSNNRHKMTTLTPALHCESYSVDDNRFDLRQFLYNSNWTFQFSNIKKFVNNQENLGLKLKDYNSKF
jgi:NAD+ synthase (glutamine-hydrolysing)